MEKVKAPSKNVRFSSHVMIFLIPNQIDLAPFKHILWYDDTDYYIFSQSYMKYIQEKTHINKST